MTMKLSLTSQSIDKISCELVVLMHFRDQLPFKDLLGKLDWRVNGRLSQYVQNEKYTGDAKELLLMPSEFRFKANEIIILGLGEHRSFEEGHVGEVLDYFLDTASKKKSEQVCFSIHQLLDNEFAWRNAVRLLISKAVDYPSIKEIVLCEPVSFIRDAKKRRLDFGPHIPVEFF
jgi:hypothetical protein